jgi:esterase/lipase
VGTLLHNIRIADDNSKVAHLINKPFHISYGRNDKVISLERIKDFYEKIETEKEKKEMVEHEAEHYLLSDGWVKDGVVEKQILWLNSFY